MRKPSVRNGSYGVRHDRDRAVPPHPGPHPRRHGVRRRLRGAGHTVHTPDLFEGRTFGSIERGRRRYSARSASTRCASAGCVPPPNAPEAVVYAGFSLGVMPAQQLLQTRPGALGGLFYHSFADPSWFGEWPSGVPVQIHSMDADPFFVDEGDIDAARPFVESHARRELFLYPGDGHLFTDSSAGGLRRGRPPSSCWTGRSSGCGRCERARGRRPSSRLVRVAFRDEQLLDATFDHVDLTGSRWNRVDLTRAYLHDRWTSPRSRSATSRSRECGCAASSSRTSRSGASCGRARQRRRHRAHWSRPSSTASTPSGPRLRPTDPAGLPRGVVGPRRAVGRDRRACPAARGVDPDLLHESVDGEWSFIETLRHLAFATSSWLRRAHPG